MNPLINNSLQKHFFPHYAMSFYLRKFVPAFRKMPNVKQNRSVWLFTPRCARARSFMDSVQVKSEISMNKL